MAEALEGSGKPLIICSGTLSYPKGVLADENTEPERRAGIDRDLSVEMIKKLSHEKNIRGMVVRLSPTVHGKGDHVCALTITSISCPLLTPFTFL